MQKQAPTLGRLAVLVVFALSCVVVLTYLWTTFGGPTPLGAKGYRFQADFEEATQLADNADVRISGVTVGRVIRSEQVDDATRTEIEIDTRYAPIPKNTRATLRQKTLMGETYVEITPGDKASGDLADGGLLPAGQVRPTVELDEILRALDERTRTDLQRFLRGTAAAFDRRGGDVNAAVGHLPSFASDARTLVEILDTQERAVHRVVRDSGEVFESLGRGDGQLAGLIRAVDTVVTTTAGRNADLEETVRILPTTLRELQPTLADVESISREARPLVSDLRPAARKLEPTLRDGLALAPDLRGLFGEVDRVIDISHDALPATTRTVEAAHPLFEMLEPVLQEAQPVVDYLGMFEAELVAAFAGVAAVTQAQLPSAADGEPLHYLRALVPFTAEGMVAAKERFGSNRHNPYFGPRALEKLAANLEAIDCSNAGNQPAPEPAPPCVVQEPLDFRGQKTAYPQIRKDP